MQSRKSPNLHLDGHMVGQPVSRRGAIALPLAVAAIGVPGPAVAATATGHAYIDEPLGIGLEGWRYPGPVSFLPLVMRRQAVRMAYMDFAPTTSANGRAILLLPGKNFDSSYWTGPIAWLRDAGFRVIVPDQIGFNKSSKPDVDYSFEVLSRNTIELANALSLKQIVVLGIRQGALLRCDWRVCTRSA
jgi:pimeloyl-ACP methyl ester carboxylesterase